MPRLDTPGEPSTTDVGPAWFRSRGFGQDPEPSRPLSETGVSVHPRIRSGATAAEATIPTITDTPTDPAEHIRLLVIAIPPDIFGAPVTTGEAGGP
jgi:hypothetical protein